MNELIRWVAAKQERDPSGYSEVRVRAEPFHAWSDITVEDFSCMVTFKYEGGDGHYDMNDKEACEFLSSLSMPDA